MEALSYPFINFFECTPSCECPALSLFHSPNELRMRNVQAAQFEIWLLWGAFRIHNYRVEFINAIYHAAQNAERRGNLFCTGPSLSWLVSGFNYAEAADVLLGSCHPGRDVLIFYAFISSICVGGPHPLGLGLEGSGVCCVWRDN